jgi:hypothetical protein
MRCYIRRAETETGDTTLMTWDFYQKYAPGLDPDSLRTAATSARV